MARISSYIKDTSPNDADLLVGSEYQSTLNGIDTFQTKSYKLSDLAGYFASYFVQNGSAYNLATITGQISTVVTDSGNTATALTALTSSFGKRVFRQDAEPTTSGIPLNSIWYDTNDGNKLYIFDGTNWVIAGDDRLPVVISSNATALSSISTNAGEISSGATKITELESQFVFTGANITGVADALSTSITTISTSAAGAVASDLDKLEAVFSFDSSGDVDGTSGVLSTAVTSSANTAIANASLASATSVDKLEAVFSFGSDGNIDGTSGVLSTAVTSSANTAIANASLASASALNTLSSLVGADDSSGIRADIITNASTLATVEGYSESRYSLKLTAGGSFAGMSILASDGSTSDPFSEIRFQADSFKIFNNGSAGDTTDYTAPFEVVGGVVKIKSANIGTVSFGDLSGAPTTAFMQQVAQELPRL